MLLKGFEHDYDHGGCLVIKARVPADRGALIVNAFAFDFTGHLPRITLQQAFPQQLRMAAFIDSGRSNGWFQLIR